MELPNSKWSKTPNKTLVTYLHELKQGSVLDLGGSNGVNAVYLAQQGFGVTNVDLDVEALDGLTLFAKENTLNITTIQADLNEYSIDKDYDNIISFYMFHFLPKDVGDKLLTEMQDHTIEGGINMVIGFTDHGEFEVNPTKCYFVGSYLLDKYNSWEVLYHTRFSASTKAGLTQEREVLVARKM